MENGGTTLPQLGPALEERKRAAPSRSSSTQPYSARLSRDDRSNHVAREEEAVRAVYKKHAQSFFEEVKEGFLKEAAALRRQAQKAFARADVAWDVCDAAGTGESLEAAAPSTGRASPALASLQAHLLTLQRQVGDLQVSFNTRQAAGAGGLGETQMQECARASSRGAGRLPDQSPSPSPSAVGGSSLSEKVARQQDEIKALSRLVKSEFAAAKKAALTPMWKERALQEIAQGELRAVCADEVGKAFRDFASAFSEREAEAAVTRLCESGATPMESRLRAELEVVQSRMRADLGAVQKDLCRQVIELSCRADEGTAARAVLADRLGTVEESQLKQSSEIVKIEANLQSMHREGLRDVRKQVEGLTEMLSDRIGSALTKIDSVEAKCTALHSSLNNNMQTSLAEEASQRQRSVATVVADLDALRRRSEDEHKQLKEQISTASASCADACRQVAQVHETTKAGMQQCSEAVISAQEASAASRSAAQAADALAASAQRLAEEVAVEARGASAGAEQARSAAESAQLESGSARRAADAAAASAVQGTSAITQHATRLTAAEKQLHALENHAVNSADQIKTHSEKMWELEIADNRISSELAAAIKNTSDQIDRGILSLRRIVEAQGQRVDSLSEAASAASPRKLPSLINSPHVNNSLRDQSFSTRDHSFTNAASASSGQVMSLSENFDRGAFDDPVTRSFDFADESEEDALEMFSTMADDVTAAMMVETCRNTFGSMGGEDSRAPSVASMSRSTPASDM